MATGWRPLTLTSTNTTSPATTIRINIRFRSLRSIIFYSHPSPVAGKIDGVIHKVVVFVDEPSDLSPQPVEEDIFAEMEAFTVRVGNADDSRESLYTRMEGE